MSRAPPVPGMVTVREADAGDDRDLDLIASLHMELLGYGPMAGLGRRFVRQICYGIHMRDELLRVVIATVDGQPAGIVAYTPFSATFHRGGLRGHFLEAGLEAMLAVMSRPARALKLVRALRVLGARRTERTRIDQSVGEVVCIAVRPQYLKSGFTRAFGSRLSEFLVVMAANYLRRCGNRRMRMLVDAENRPVLMLYHLLGARFAPYDLGGEPMVEVEFELTGDRLTADPAIPDAWSGEARPGDSATSWGSYWESVGECRNVFESEARDFVTRLGEVVALHGGTKVLDFGCGFGYAARLLAPQVSTVTIWDGSANVRSRARLRTAHLSNIVYADLAASDSDPRAAFDLITVHSVVQYMNQAEFSEWLARWRKMLTPSGCLVISDLIQAQTSSWREMLRYIQFSSVNGFLWTALMQGVREIGNYSRARSSRPLLEVTPELLVRLSIKHKWTLEILTANLSYRQDRITAVLRPA